MGRERGKATLHRRRPFREPYDLVLIVCEGRKTEPNYFDALKRELNLSSANIRVCGKECGASPISVVDYALGEYKKNTEYDRIICVFDKDSHEAYKEAIDKIKNAKLRGKVIKEAITSVPCFEYWLLLHYEDSARPYAPAGKRSPCDDVIRDLKKYIPDYDKGDNDIFKQTYPFIGEAIRRAELLEVRQAKGETDNPSTKIHHLVKYLSGLKQSS